MMLAYPATTFDTVRHPSTGSEQVLMSGAAGIARATVFKEPCHTGNEKALEHSVHPFPIAAQQAKTNKTLPSLKKERLIEIGLRRCEFSELSCGMFSVVTAH